MQNLEIVRVSIQINRLCHEMFIWLSLFVSMIITGKGNGKLWEFIRDLLLDPVTNPSFIRWERREDGIFKFVQSDKVAKLWGQRKQNPRMTYEKLSRAMRYEWHYSVIWFIVVLMSVKVLSTLRLTTRDKSSIESTVVTVWLFVRRSMLIAFSSFFPWLQILLQESSIASCLWTKTGVQVWSQCYRWATRIIHQ